MQALFKTIIDGFREDFGHPASLMHLLSTYPQIRVALNEPKACISAQSVTPWHKLGASSVLQWPCRKHGTLMGWKSAGRYWESFEINQPEYAHISHCEVTPGWSCDITDIHGFLASKSNLRTFTNTDEMVETNSRNMIDEITSEKLAQNLAHKEIRIIHSPETTTDHFVRYQWDGRLWLMNDGGSHHTAAAKYISTRLAQPVILTGKLYTYSLNAIAIASLRRQFEMFVINDDPEIANAFFNAMRAFRATWLWHTIPRPYEHTKAILLPRSEARSMRVAAELRQAGILDLGVHLAVLARNVRPPN